MNDYFRGQGDGLLTKAGRRLFPLGFYEFPKDDAQLKAMAEAGVNLVRCGSKEDLDRVKSLGMMGWISLAVHSGVTDNLRKQIESVVDHPALAVWEGPDEVVWNFTAWSHLWRKDRLGVFEHEGEWWMQTPLVIEYSETKAKEIMPNMHAAIQLVRSLDKHNRQFWINEARDSDLKFVRQYLDYVDITGCDDYPIRRDNRDAVRVGTSTERWKQVGSGRPVWMVLQGFSWSDLEEHDRAVAYPTFAESRLMAYDCIAHGARGILYWGSSYLKSPGFEAFRESLYALTSELAALQLFLTAPEERYAQVGVIERRRRTETVPKAENLGDTVYTELGVRMTARRTGRDWLIILVNEDNKIQMGVEVSGLDDLNGMDFVLLYGDETVTVKRGELVTRMMPHEVKIFATSRKWETDRRKGRDFAK
ncbi:hypothetical protein FJZ31_21595 [Candidatus Poribacteria bacterium]|nr:hypothetical protein [Candidatus Poribacteria bacterium]